MQPKGRIPDQYQFPHYPYRRMMAPVGVVLLSVLGGPCSLFMGGDVENLSRQLF